ISWGAFLQQVANRLQPSGRLYVLGYPEILAPSGEWGYLEGFLCNGVTRGTANKLKRVTDHLDSVLHDEASKANSNDLSHRVRYISVVDAFRHHQLCGNEHDWMNGIALNHKTFHPNFDGNAAESELLLAAIKRDPPEVTSVPETSKQAMQETAKRF